MCEERAHRAGCRGRSTGTAAAGRQPKSEHGPTSQGSAAVAGELKLAGGEGAPPRIGRQGPHPGRRPAVKVPADHGRHAQGRLGDWAASAPDLAGGQGVPLPDRPSGPTPGAAAGSQSPGEPRAAKPRVSRRARSAPPGQVARAQDPGAAAGLRPHSAAAQPRAKAEAVGRD